MKRATVLLSALLATLVSSFVILFSNFIRRGTIYFALSCVLFSCVANKKSFNPHKKFSPQQLQKDFDLYQNILEERHPSLYWYTSKSIMDKAFEEEREQLKDSLTEYEFRKLLTRINTKIQCGHTSVKASKQYLKYVDTLKSKTTFPLFVKVWNDTVVIVHNIYKNDKRLVRGTIIDSVNGVSVKKLMDTMYHYINADGSNLVAKDQILSTGTWFGSLYTSLYGWKKQYNIAYRDSASNIQHSVLKPVVTKADTTQRGKVVLTKPKKLSRKELLAQARSLKIDSGNSFALMELNSFSEKLKLKRFFRHSFHQLKKQNISNLIIDLRNNGGGRVDNSNLLTRYITDKPFKLADSLYAKTRTSKYSQYIKNDFWSKLTMMFLTSKRASEQYHFRYYEKHYFKPRRRNHFDGSVYILSGGNSFSASTLVMSVLKPQQNVTIVGEPSGGAAYGNSAWFIKEVTLPNTAVRFRLPLFRLVINKSLSKDGQGVLPEVFAGPSTEAIKRGNDYKMQKAMQLIKEK